MKLTEIELRNFRVFDEAKFDLTHPQTGKPLEVVLLVGSNGAGKSSVLQGIAGFFQAARESFGTSDRPSYEGDALAPEDVRNGCDDASLQVAWSESLDGERDAALRARAVLLPAPRAVASGGSWGPGVLLGPFHAPTEQSDIQPSPYMPRAAQKWIRQVFRSDRSPEGLISLYDVFRLMPPTQVAGPNINEVFSHRCEASLAPTVRRSGRIVNRHGRLKQWIVNLDFLRAKAKADRQTELPLRDTLQRALNRIFSPYVFDGVDDRFEVWFRTPHGRVRLEALSDGFRSIFVIITDMLMRLSLCTDDMTRVLDQEAVCMIDEIDAHLHPNWQEKVMPALRTLFPNVQFVATTHSPIVVATVEPHNVFVLEEDP
jgi:hypothetical protein